MIKAEQHWRS